MTTDKWLLLLEPILYRSPTSQPGDPLTLVDEAEQFTALRFGASDLRTIITRLVKATTYAQRKKFKAASETFKIVVNDSEFLTNDMQQIRFAVAATLGLLFCAISLEDGSDVEALSVAQLRVRRVLYEDVTLFSEACAGLAKVRLGMGDISGAIEELAFLRSVPGVKVSLDQKGLHALLLYASNQAVAANELLSECLESIINGSENASPTGIAVVHAFAQQLVDNHLMDDAQKVLELGQSMVDEYYSRFDLLSIQSRIRLSQAGTSSLAKAAWLQEILDEGDDSEFTLEKLAAATMLADLFDSEHHESHVIQLLARAQNLKRQLLGTYESQEKVEKAASDYLDSILSGEHPAITRALAMLAQQSPLTYVDQLIRNEMQQYRVTL